MLARLVSDEYNTIFVSAIRITGYCKPFILMTFEATSCLNIYFFKKSTNHLNDSQVKQKVDYLISGNVSHMAV